LLRARLFQGNAWYNVGGCSGFFALHEWRLPVILAVLEPMEWGAIIAGVLVIVGFIYWRLRMNRKSKSADERLDTAP
jgi:hypothetical protein